MTDWLRRTDDVAHFLYCPTLRNGSGVSRWHHRIHLIPGFVLERICDAWDRANGWDGDV